MDIRYETEHTISEVQAACYAQCCVSAYTNSESHYD